MAELVDQFGRPLVKADLKREIATAELTGVRQVWQPSVALGLTPAALAGVLRAATEGDHDSYLTLAEEMEERELHYAAVLGNRKQAVSGLEVTVEAADDSAEALRHAEFIERLVAAPAFDELLEDQLDALGKGFSVCEILWDTSERQWLPQAYPHRDARWFQWDRASMRELRLRDSANLSDGIPLAPFKFLVHQPRIKTGLPVRGGLARLVAFAFICKAYALKDWVAFAEVFGMPIRVGRYGASANEEDIRVLKRAVANIGSDAAAVLPDSMKIEFQEASKGNGGADVYERLCSYIDRQISKAVLGQTMTTESGGGSGLAQAKVHNEVRADIQRKDAKQLAKTINAGIVRPVIDLNFGPQKAYPKVCIYVPEAEDLAGLVNALDKLVPLGLRVEQSVIRDKWGLPEPAKDAEVLGAPQRAPAAPAGTPAPPPAPAATGAARNAAQPGAPDDGEDAADRLADALQRQSTTAEDAIVDQVRAVIDSAESFEQMLAGLDALLPKVDRSRQGALLRDALALAYLRGRSDVQDAAAASSGG